MKYKLSFRDMLKEYLKSHKLNIELPQYLYISIDRFMSVELSELEGLRVNSVVELSNSNSKKEDKHDSLDNLTGYDFANLLGLVIDDNSIRPYFKSEGENEKGISISVTNGKGIPYSLEITYEKFNCLFCLKGIDPNPFYLEIEIKLDSNYQSTYYLYSLRYASNGDLIDIANIGEGNQTFRTDLHTNITDNNGMLTIDYDTFKELEADVDYTIFTIEKSQAEKTVTPSSPFARQEYIIKSDFFNKCFNQLGSDVCIPFCKNISPLVIAKYIAEIIRDIHKAKMNPAFDPRKASLTTFIPKVYKKVSVRNN